MPPKPDHAAGPKPRTFTKFDAPAFIDAMSKRPSPPSFLADEPAARLTLTYAANAFAARCSADDAVVREIADVVSAEQSDIRGGGFEVVYQFAR